MVLGIVRQSKWVGAPACGLKWMGGGDGTTPSSSKSATCDSDRSRGQQERAKEDSRKGRVRKMGVDCEVYYTTSPLRSR